MILTDKKDGVGVITLNRPEKYHSFNREMALALQAALLDCAQDPAVRCVLLTATGKAFCAGQDLAEFPDPAAIPFEKIVREHYNPVIVQIAAMEKPVLAAVNGVAAGAGANLALACDIVVAAESASFIQAFSKIGLVPDSGGTYFLPRLVGLQKAMALMMLGDKVTAQEAESMGMIYKALPDEEFAEKSLELARNMATMPTRALALTKRLLQDSMKNGLNEQLELEKKLQSEAGATGDFKEGVQAFLEKRKPVFAGA